MMDVSKKLALSWVLGFCALMVISLAYSNHFYNSFHFDDFHVLVNNAYIQDLYNFKLFFTDTSTASALPANQLYRPLFTFSLAVDYWLGHAVEPLWFHISTFVWYLSLCVLLYFFFSKIAQVSVVSRWNMIFSWFAVTWYGLHTANAETINYISARSDSVSTFWLICSFIMFIYWPKHRRWGVYLVPLIIGLLFKQTLLVFPGLLFLYVLYFEERNGVNALRPCLNAFKTILPALMTCMIMCVFLIKMLPASADTGGGSAYAYLITQPYVMLHYFITFFLPLQLSADTDLARLTSMADPRFFMGTAFVLSMMILAFFTSKHVKTRPISFGIFWFFIALIPTSVIPLAEVMNDHRIFFPFIGLLLAVAFGLYLVVLKYTEQLKKERGLIIVCILGLLGAHGYGTYERNQIWKTEASLWKDVSIKSPNNGRGLMNYGLTLMAEGHYDQAEKYFLRSLKLNPYYGVLHTNLGILKQAKGKTSEAETYFKQAMQYGPHDPGAVIVRHVVNLGQGAALETGIKYAVQQGAEYIVTFDADNQHHADEIIPMLDALKSSHADIALGSRFLGRSINIPWGRRFILKTAIVFTYLTNRTKFTDVHNGFRIMTRHFCEHFEFQQNRMAHASEILNYIARLKINYIEYPVTITYTEYSLRKGQRITNGLRVLVELFIGKLF